MASHGKLFTLTLFTACLAFTSGAHAQVAAPKRIAAISAASIELASTSGSARVCARGTVNSGGWSSFRLVPKVYVVEPADGIWDVDFVGSAPPNGKIVTQAIVPVKANYVWQTYPKTLKGIRINSASNSIVAMMGDGKPAC